MAHRPQTVSLCVAWLPSLPAHSLKQIVHLISENCFPKCRPGVGSVDTIEASEHETALLVIVGVVLFFSCLLHEKMVWLDLSGALPWVSSVPGVTHIVTWFTSFCSMAILSYGLHLSMTLQAPSSFCVCMPMQMQAQGMCEGLLKAAAHVRVLQSLICNGKWSAGSLCC